ncbi:MAG: acetyl-CoA carboxylase carboxyltransferase subunit alpha [Brevinema sp.]
MHYLEFEQSFKEYDTLIEQLKSATEVDQPKIDVLEKKRDAKMHQIFDNLTPWQITQVARHPERPGFEDYLKNMFTDFLEFHGDRYFGDDAAIITGWGTLRGEKCIVIGQEKGKDITSRIKRNFGMPNPEGYRKALRAVKLAEKFKKPVLTFVDTAGAYPGLGAEERGQGEAIARNIMEFFGIKVPIISTVIGEGGSGGALGIAVADRVLTLEYSIYSVISPESCASILWHDATKNKQAADALCYTAPHLLEFGIVDEIVKEPLGGAHRDHAMTMQLLADAIIANLESLKKRAPARLVQQRYDRFRKIGFFNE